MQEICLDLTCPTVIDTDSIGYGEFTVEPNRCMVGKLTIVVVID